MRRVTALLSVIAVGLWTVSTFAQAKPSFAGKWVREAPAGGGAPGGGGGGRGGGGGGWGMNPTITQDDKTLTVEYTGGGQNPAPMKLVFKLDGTESTNQVMGRGGEPAPQVSTATWKGSTLVIVTKGANGDTTRTVSLDGGNLVIDQTGPGREGTPVTQKIVYKKA